MENFPTLSRLRLLEKELRTDISGRYRRKKWESILGGVGLMLIEPTSSYCESTPPGVLSFSETGGDSVHFGFLAPPRPYSENSPIVLCVPEVNYSAVVAEGLTEFLAIGCEHGWHHLEDLAYECESTVAMYSDVESKHAMNWPQKDNVLERVRETLSVKWQPLRSARLKYLSETYAM